MAEPVTRNDCNRDGVCSDGLTIRFLSDCSQGLTGEVVKKSANAARELVTLGLA
jgi:hypothetical protein